MTQGQETEGERFGIAQGLVTPYLAVRRSGTWSRVQPRVHTVPEMAGNLDASQTGKPTRIQSASRAARILLYVASTGGNIDIRRISEDLKLSLATTYHLVNTLVEEGLLSRNPDRRITLGPAISIIADAHARDSSLPEGFQAVLREVAQRTGETAYISAWRGEVVVVLASVEGSNAVRVVGLSPGFGGNLHARASGKLLLAFAPPERKEGLLAQMTLEAVTPRTITSKGVLRKELERVARAGVAFDVEEFQAGVACIAVPLRFSGSVVAALTISTPISRFRDNKQELLTLLKETIPAELSD